MGEGHDRDLLAADSALPPPEWLAKYQKDPDDYARAEAFLTRAQAPLYRGDPVSILALTALLGWVREQERQRRPTASTDLLGLVATFARDCIVRGVPLDNGSAEACNLHALAQEALGYPDPNPQVPIADIVARVRGQILGTVPWPCRESPTPEPEKRGVDWRAVAEFAVRADDRIPREQAVERVRSAREFERRQTLEACAQLCERYAKHLREVESGASASWCVDGCAIRIRAIGDGPLPSTSDCASTEKTSGEDEAQAIVDEKAK